MIITIESPSGNRKWRLEPFDNGLCWRLLKSSIDPKAKSKWIDCTCYHSSLASALEALVERMLKDPEDPVSLEFTGVDIKRSVVRVLKNRIKDLTMEVEDGQA